MAVRGSHDGDVAGTADFLAEAAALAARLRGHRSLFEVRYDGLSFGSWTLVGGTPKRRVRVVWDGREGELSAEAATLGNAQDWPQWRPVAAQRPGDPAPGAVLRLAEELILRIRA